MFVCFFACLFVVRPSCLFTRLLMNLCVGAQVVRAICNYSLVVVVVVVGVVVVFVAAAFV